MPELVKNTIAFNWHTVKPVKEDWDKQNRCELLSMLQQLYIIRAFETAVLELKEEGLIHGPVHSSIGQEAVAVGAIGALRKKDYIAGTHRAHHQFLAKVLAYYTPENFDPLVEDITSQMQDSINRLLAEIMGFEPGYCRGRGGSMHLCEPEAGVIGTNAIVGGGIPISTGVAFAQKYQKTDNIVISFFGDGAVNQGAFHEALNLAGLWKCPIVYLIENNLYGVATHVREVVPVKELLFRAVSYDMDALLVDGMDPLAVKAGVQQAIENFHQKGDIYIIEAKTYRFKHHSGNFAGSVFGYRNKEEEMEWRNKDPLIVFPKHLRDLGLLDDKADSHIKDSAEKTIAAAIDFCTQKDKKTSNITIKDTLLPKDESLKENVLSNGREFERIEFVEANETSLDREIKYVAAIASVTERWMEKDPRVFVLGEEVGHFGGGAYQATKGLPQRYPERVFNTPISEAGFSGLACGAAMAGLRPVVEIMFPDFVLVAADQIFNQIGKLRYIYGGSIDIPLVMRTRIAIGCGYGGQHSMDPIGLFALFPGWRIVAPSTPFDYIGLFNSAMTSLDPVLIVEHQSLYNERGLIPKDNLDYFIKMGKAKIKRAGKDVTVLSYSSTVSLSEKAADILSKEGIETEVIDLRTLDLANIDYDTIGNSIKKTNTLVIVEEAPRVNSLGAALAGECSNRFFDYFDVSVKHIAGGNISMPVSRRLESLSVPSLDYVIKTFRSAANRD